MTEYTIEQFEQSVHKLEDSQTIFATLPEIQPRKQDRRKCKRTGLKHIMGLPMNEFFNRSEQAELCGIGHDYFTTLLKEYCKDNNYNFVVVRCKGCMIEEK